MAKNPGQDRDNVTDFRPSRTPHPLFSPEKRRKKRRPHPARGVVLLLILLAIALILLLSRTPRQSAAVPLAAWQSILDARPAQPVIDRMAAYLDCPTRLFPPTQDAVATEQAFVKALADGRDQGFTPVLVAVDENLLGDLLWEAPSPGALDLPQVRAARRALLAADLPDGAQWLAQRQAELSDLFAFYEQNAAEAFPFGFSGAPYGGVQPVDLLLAQVPTADPWQVFGWIPMGGWNDCPEPAAMMAVAKHWHEAYGAVPACITRDTVVFYLPKGLGRRDSRQAAREHLAFCPDSGESLDALARQIRGSHYWYFWWD